MESLSNAAQNAKWEGVTEPSLEDVDLRVTDLEQEVEKLKGALESPESGKNPLPYAKRYAEAFDVTDWFRMDPTDLAATVVDPATGASVTLKHTDSAWDLEFYRRTPYGDRKVGMFKEAARLARQLVIERLPRLEAVTHTPYITASGRVVAKPGYDIETGVYLAGGLGVPRFGTMTVDEAKDLLTEWVCDFPFASGADRSVFLAAALTLAARPMLGLAPMFLMDATRRDSGKGMLMEILTLFATGDNVLMDTWQHSGDELEKRVTTALRAGRNPIVFDEAHVLNSVNLCAALTAERWSGRILGKSTGLTARMDKLTFFAAGNNQQVRGDLRRRVAGLRLAPDYTEEEGRSRPLRHPNLKAWTREHRADLLTAAMTLWQSWFDAGSPEGLVRLGSFEHWSQSVSGCLANAGLPDLVIYVPGAEESVSVEGKLLSEIRQAGGAGTFTADSVIGWIANEKVDWPWAMPAYETDTGFKKAISQKLNGLKGGVFDFQEPVTGNPMAIRLLGRQSHGKWMFSTEVRKQGDKW